MAKIKFGTDGWRAIIANEYTVDNVARVATATAKWVKQDNDKPVVVIGYDCRFGGKMFAETTAAVLLSEGVKVLLSHDFASTPMVSLGTLHYKAHLGVVITASHNPPSYNGYKLKASFGGPLLLEQVEELEALIPDQNDVNLSGIDLASYKDAGQLEYIDLESLYCDHVAANFDLDAIRNSGLKFVYDAMYGAGQNVIRRLLPETTLLHCDENPSFKGQAPEPIHRNLKELSEMMKSPGGFDSGLATDGDADRIGLYDHKGDFVDSHHIILLLIHYMTQYKQMSGKVCVAFSVSQKVKTLCEKYNLDIEVVKIGFKYVCEVMQNEDVLIGGEESGGIAIKGHIPERDGIWMGLVIWEYMVKSGKSLAELIQEIYAIVGSFSYGRSDLHIDEDTKTRVMDACKARKYNSFGAFSVEALEDLDGYKYHFKDDSWFMIRPSGTEPVLRTYAEASSELEVKSILDAGYKTLIN